MAYSTISKPSLHFNTATYAGNGGTNAITGLGFQPDLVWTKNRSATANHLLYDAVRGVRRAGRDHIFRGYFRLRRFT